jgi:hypothetical protein
MGALKAAAMPAAIPTEAKRREFLGPSRAMRASMLLAHLHCRPFKAQ